MTAQHELTLTQADERLIRSIVREELGAVLKAIVPDVVYLRNDPDLQAIARRLRITDPSNQPLPLSPQQRLHDPIPVPNK